MDDSTEIVRDLFEQHADAVYRYAKYCLPSNIDAKDVVQEVFLRAYLHWEDFRGNSDRKTWLFRIARNYIYDLLRRQRRQRLYEAKMRNTQDCVQLDTIIELEEALQRLSFAHRQVLNLRWIQGMSVLETADLLGWSESKVRVTFHRAKKKLKELLRDSSDRLWDVKSNGGDTTIGKFRG